MVEPRRYRQSLGSGRFVDFVVEREETDLWVAVDCPSFDPAMPAALGAFISRQRERLWRYIISRPAFLHSFEPLPEDPGAPKLASVMLRAAALAGVGPMAAVAGAFADAAATFLREKFHCREVLVENGGDDAILVEVPVLATILAGDSPLSGKFGILAGGSGAPTGLATSSGRLGHSYSAGRAHACVAIAADSAHADAFATAFGNRVGSPADIGPALALAAKTRGLLGLALVIGKDFGCVGRIAIRPLAGFHS